MNWDFMFDPPSIHEDDSCESCHSEHVSENMVYQNATEWPAQFPCCVSELEDMKADGRICMKHPTAYFEPAGSGGSVTCLKCGAASVAGSNLCHAHGGMTDKRPAFCEGCDNEKNTLEVCHG